MPDFTAMWSEWLTQSERQWNTFFNETMNTDQFSQSLGGMMDFYIAMQKGFSDQMARYLATVNMPSRTDILAVNDRLLDIENRLAAIEARLTSMGAATNTADATRRPARTRKLPSENS
jgi:polyhydroxyalkanoic acid synthase PhaR subunit